MSGHSARAFLNGSRFVIEIGRTCCAVALLWSCSEPADGAERTQRAALIGGTVSEPADDAVVFLRGNRDDGSFTDCTATLISPRVVLTAKHCVVEVQPGNFVCSGNGELIHDGTDAGIMGATLPAKNIEIHVGVNPNDAVAAVGANVYVTRSNDACHDDVAALVLDRPVAAPRYPALRRTRSTRKGETVRLLGYGMGERRGKIERHEVAEVRVLDLANETAPDDESATTPRRTFAVGGDAACFGDSGGPALASDTSALVGLYSRITGDCFAVQSRNTFMLAESYGELFDMAAAEAGETPQLEPAPEPQRPRPEPAAAAATESHDAFKCGFTPGPRGTSPWSAALYCLAALLALKGRRRGAS